MMKTIVALLFATGCVADPESDNTSSPATADTGGCPVGQQPVFSGHGNELVCDDVPMWPPPATGSRSVAEPGCELADGAYRGAWTTADPAATKNRPAFTYLKELTIAGDRMVEVDIGYTSTWLPPILTPYTYNLDWLNASSANVWEPGNHDTWEWVAWRDCVNGKLHVTRALNLPYPNPGGPQIESWTFEGTLVPAT